LPLAALRKTLVMHPATLGQAIDELRRMGHCVVRRDQDDKRARVVAITPQGVALIEQAPLAGPIRLRQLDHDPARLERLAAALGDAIDLFGLAPWMPDQKEEKP
jgi:MarR family transcriptional regulator, temperature-dependent positive regulator of motility